MEVFTHTHVLSSREDRTTDTEEAAIAAEPIQGCSTRPAGMNTPGAQRRDQGINEDRKPGRMRLGWL